MWPSGSRKPFACINERDGPESGRSRPWTVTAVFDDGDTLDEFVSTGRLPPESCHGRAESRVEVSSS